MDDLKFFFDCNIFLSKNAATFGERLAQFQYWSPPTVEQKHLRKFHFNLKTFLSINWTLLNTFQNLKNITLVFETPCIIFLIWSNNHVSYFPRALIAFLINNYTNKYKVNWILRASTHLQMLIFVSVGVGKI